MTQHEHSSRAPYVSRPAHVVLSTPPETATSRFLMPYGLFHIGNVAVTNLLGWNLQSDSSPSILWVYGFMTFCIVRAEPRTRAKSYIRCHVISKHAWGKRDLKLVTGYCRKLILKDWHSSELTWYPSRSSAIRSSVRDMLRRGFGETWKDSSQNFVTKSYDSSPTCLAVSLIFLAASWGFDESVISLPTIKLARTCLHTGSTVAPWTPIPASISALFLRGFHIFLYFFWAKLRPTTAPSESALRAFLRRDVLRQLLLQYQRRLSTDRSLRMLLCDSCTRGGLHLGVRVLPLENRVKTLFPSYEWVGINAVEASSIVIISDDLVCGAYVVCFAVHNGH